MSTNDNTSISNLITAVHDFPKKGITFRDVSLLLRDRQALDEAVEKMCAPFLFNQGETMVVDAVAGIDARGFIFGTLIAKQLGVGFVMLRKPNRLPNALQVSYNIEYMKNQTLEIGKDVIAKGERVLVVDDVLATGGSAVAACKLVKAVGGVVAGVCSLIELVGLDGRKRLQQFDGFRVHCVLEYAAHTQKLIGQENEGEIVMEEYEPLEMTRNPEDDRVIVLAYPPMRRMAEQICLLYPTRYRMGHIKWGHFPDGWPNVQFDHMDVLEGKHVLFLGSLREQTSLTEQLSLLMVLPRQHVQSLNISLPYFAPATMERVEQEGILATAETVARLISTTMPITRNGPAVLRIFDLHALPVRFYFHDQVNMRLTTAIPLLLRELRGKRVTIAFPDEGALKRFKNDFLGYPTVVCTKIREGDKRVVRIADHINWPAEPLERIRAKAHVIIVDDLVQTGGTLHECRHALLSEGFDRISAYVTHAVFPNESHLRFAKGGDREGFHQFFTTDTVPETADKLRQLEPFKVLEIGSTVATDILSSLGVRPTEIIENYMPIYVYVASDLDSRLRGVKDAFDAHFITDVVRVFSVPVPSGVNVQPIGEEEMRKGCRNRLLSLVRYIRENQSHIHACIYAVSIESGFTCDEENVWSDKAIIQVAKFTGETKLSTKGEKPLNFDIHIFETDSVPSPEGVPVEEYMKSRGEVTIGSLIERRLGLLDDTWHKFVSGRSRSQIIQQSMKSYIERDENATEGWRIEIVHI